MTTLKPEAIAWRHVYWNEKQAEFMGSFAELGIRKCMRVLEHPQMDFHKVLSIGKANQETRCLMDVKAVAEVKHYSAREIMVSVTALEIMKQTVRNIAQMVLGFQAIIKASHILPDTVEAAQEAFDLLEKASQAMVYANSNAVSWELVFAWEKMGGMSQETYKWKEIAAIYASLYTAAQEWARSAYLDTYGLIAGICLLLPEADGNSDLVEDCVQLALRDLQRKELESTPVLGEAFPGEVMRAWQESKGRREPMEDAMAGWKTAWHDGKDQTSLAIIEGFDATQVWHKTMKHDPSAEGSKEDRSSAEEVAKPYIIVDETSVTVKSVRGSLTVSIE